MQNGKTCRAQDEGKVNQKELKGDMNGGGGNKNKNSAPTHHSKSELPSELMNKAACNIKSKR